MAAPMSKFTLTLCWRNPLQHLRNYSIKPPPSFEKIIRYGALRPDQDEVILPTLDQRLEEVKNDIGDLKVVDIGVSHNVSRAVKKDALRLWRNRRTNAELEQAARLQKLKIPIEDVTQSWQKEYGPLHMKKIAEHYGIYHDLFSGAYFLPVVPLRIAYEVDEENVSPVFRGNKIPPAEASKQPLVSFEAKEGSLWTLLLSNPDGHLQDNDAEYLHWMVGNIPAGDVSKGQVLCDYLQPFPPRGTGFHRYVFILFEQSLQIDFAAVQRPPNCTSLRERTFKTEDFLRKFEDQLTPMGLSFFQSEYDDSVKDVFHNTFDMREPSFEYVHPTPYHPPQKAYPKREPFDRYFDRYRDKKDIAEEVLKMKLSMISPFKEYEPPKYPLIHRARKGEKPSWLIKREEKMHRRVEQFKDLP